MHVCEAPSNPATQQPSNPATQQPSNPATQQLSNPSTTIPAAMKRFFALAAITLPLLAAPPAVLPERARPDAVNAMLRDRLDNLLPKLMRETGIDMWVIINREYVEDPVYLTIVPEPTFAARRTTMLVFFDRGAEKGVERLTVSRYPHSGFYEAAWQGGDLDAQWTRLGEIIRERDPRKIAVDVSRNWPFAD